jgi:hypothetical protein
METTVAAAVDRRNGARRSIEQHRIGRARVKPGHDVEVIDISSGGALVEGVRRLLPGTVVELFLVAGDLCASIRGRVLRCAIVGLKPTSVLYRGAIGFDSELRWFPARSCAAGAGSGSELPAESGTREPTTPGLR